MSTHTSENSLKNWALLVILTLIWGSSFILIKRGLEVFTPGEVGAYRMVAAASLLLPLSLPRVKHLSKTQVKNLILAGLLGSFIPAFLFPMAQTQLSSSLTGVLNALTPLFVVLVGATFFNTRITQRNAFGLVIAFIGVIILVAYKEGGGWESLTGINAYGLFVIAACICYAFNLHVIKTRFTKLKSIEISSISLLMILPLALLYLFAGTQFSYKLVTHPDAWEALGYVTILGMVGTATALILFNIMVKSASPFFASLVTYTIPIVAIMWGVLDGEVLLFGHYLGIAAVILGVWVGNRK
ncbi:EamA-like transporter family protein [Algoriphagus boseongensis]|uniref:EamA-like transporter family protein n=1 Tax=Algoriphagus boseongensis TaxID=1442587 RepID=A0A4R6T4R2_9BACT|nr:DMT family transporter [Algoriphagus boseongensis]TDQ17491.1 EamA-like transporter family protein [Algoriphagus boseongensis]